MADDSRNPAVLLFVSAFAPEHERLSRAAVRAQDLTSGPLEFLECGVGNIRAGLSLQERLLAGLHGRAPAVREVVFMGSAGVYDPDLELSQGSANAPRFGFSTDFYSTDLSLIEKRSHAPSILERELRSTPGRFARGFLAAHKETICSGTNCPTFVSLESPHPAMQTDAPFALGFENMECFGLASAVESTVASTVVGTGASAVPFAALFALTNVVGPAGSQQWAETHLRLGGLLQERVAELLGVQGV